MTMHQAVSSKLLEMLTVYNHKHSQSAGLVLQPALDKELPRWHTPKPSLYGFALVSTGNFEHVTFGIQHGRTVTPPEFYVQCPTHEALEEADYETALTHTLGQAIKRVVDPLTLGSDDARCEPRDLYVTLRVPGEQAPEGEDWPVLHTHLDGRRFLKVSALMGPRGLSYTPIIDSLWTLLP